ncbi:hypothetical protein EXIGLDRAFT_368350 [Exidia glandulosa HHB12029]|uniref:Uncharacterized protein n=1 Tax=Exidia glandulosa HHB12029 TaxID=1314781 RepID=A0A165C3L8_EXIGL|nr:hypothetical protein EXIGLDRAFT_368350 [Exidia glandulosa HHB12029]
MYKITSPRHARWLLREPCSSILVAALQMLLSPPRTPRARCLTRSRAPHALRADALPHARPALAVIPANYKRATWTPGLRAVACVTVVSRARRPWHQFLRWPSYFSVHRTLTFVTFVTSGKYWHRAQVFSRRTSQRTSLAAHARTARRGNGDSARDVTPKHVAYEI